MQMDEVSMPIRLLQRGRDARAEMGDPSRKIVVLHR